MDWLTAQLRAHASPESDLGTQEQRATLKKQQEVKQRTPQRDTSDSIDKEFPRPRVMWNACQQKVRETITV